MQIIIYTLIVSFILAALLGILLGVFKKIFAVPVDEKVEAIRAALPGANCGGCGYPGCSGFAEACAKGEAPANGCSAGGAAVAAEIGKILGVEVSTVKKAALVACRGTKECAANRGKYIGIKTCQAAALAINGTKLCSFGCIGFGDCVNACEFNGIKMGDDGLPKINYDLCVACGSCAKACPHKLISMIPVEAKVPVALCQNRSENKPSIMKNCKNGCIKCGKCERSCEAQAIHLEKGIPVVDASKCTGCGKCIEGCPTHVLAMTSDVVNK